jgi:acyl carrier protein
MNTTEALETITQVLRRIAPDVDVDELPDDVPLRAELELDSLDFLSFVEQLSKTSGRRIEEADYDALSTKASCIEFLSAT